MIFLQLLEHHKHSTLAAPTVLLISRARILTPYCTALTIGSDDSYGHLIKAVT